MFSSPNLTLAWKYRVTIKQLYNPILSASVLFCEKADIPEENDTTISIIFCYLEHRRSGLGQNSLGITYFDSVSTQRFQFCKWKCVSSQWTTQPEYIRLVIPSNFRRFWTKPLQKTLAGGRSFSMEAMRDYYINSPHESCLVYFLLTVWLALAKGTLSNLKPNSGWIKCWHVWACTLGMMSPC